MPLPVEHHTIHRRGQQAGAPRPGGCRAYPAAVPPGGTGDPARRCVPMSPIDPPYRTRWRSSDPARQPSARLPVPWAVRVLDIAEARDLLDLLEAMGASAVEVALG